MHALAMAMATWAVLLVLLLVPEPALVSSLPLNESEQRPRIHVFFANFRNEEKLYHSVVSHMRRQRLPVPAVKYTLLDMGTGDRELMKRVVMLNEGGRRITYEHLPGTEQMKGGESVPAVLAHVDGASEAPVTVVSDSDAFVLKDGWDERLLELYAAPEGYSVAAINPRSGHGPAFAGVPEWNWMSWRTAAWRGRIAGQLLADFHRLGLHDWGHWFAWYAAEHGNGAVKLFPNTGWPFPGKSPLVAGEAPGDPWAVHCFYGSRLAKEGAALDGGVSQWLISEEQLDVLFQAAKHVELQLRVRPLG